MPEKNKDFESSLKKLEEIVTELESGDLPLEKSIKAFEEICLSEFVYFFRRFYVAFFLSFC